MTFTIGFGELITIVGSIVLFTVWFIRLEGKIYNVETRQDDQNDSLKELRTKHEALDNKIVEKLSNVERSLAKIEGQLSIKKGDE